MFEDVFHESLRGLDGGPLWSENVDMNARSLVIALAVAAAAFPVTLLTRPAGSARPPDDVLPLFAVLFLAESIAFGAGVAYLVSARRTLFGPGIAPLRRAVAWSVAYLLLAPWPHDYLHGLAEINGVFNWPALAAIEYAFHFGIVPIGVLVAAFLLRSRDVPRTA
jgi:hypothetical protein